MYTVNQVSEKLNVSKVTIYSKLKKYEYKVVVKQGKKYIDEELLSMIKEELNVKEIDNDNLNIDNDTNSLDNDISIDTDDLISLNKDLTNTLIEQLKEKDKQIAQLHEQIKELHKLIENSQVLLKEEQKNNNQLLLEEHIEALDTKITDVKDKMEQRKAEQKKGIFKKIFK